MEEEGARAPGLPGFGFQSFTESQVQGHKFLMLSVIIIPPASIPGRVLFSLYVPHPQFRPGGTIRSVRDPSASVKCTRRCTFPHLLSPYRRTLRHE